MNKNLLLLSFFGFYSAIFSFAEDIPERYRNKEKNTHNGETRTVAAGCLPPSTSTELDLNNVKTLIHTGGDMWWDLQGNPKYEIPKGSQKTSLFAGSIWIGGEDINGQLKLAAVMFRGSGYDFWPGPLITSGENIATVDADVCIKYDKHFVITRNQVSEFRAWFNAPQSEKDPNYVVPDIIKNWPANGEVGYSNHLAPFYDKDNDNYYNSDNGDYPFYDLDGEVLCGTSKEFRTPRLYGDKTLWWVYNDKGNLHTETNADAIGMEIHGQAFAFSTNDELNNMTFYNYEIFNRSTYTLVNTYFGVWTDADLGYSWDDYVGCDVSRGLGYLYNGKAIDGSGQYNAYGGPTPPPPAIGVDFFEGPYQDNNGIDDRSNWDTLTGELNCEKADMMNGNINGLNFEDGVVDNERWGMRRYIYFNNDASSTGNPSLAVHFYNYLKGIWKDGTKLYYGGTGHSSGATTTTTLSEFMFPGDTDPCGWGTGKEKQKDWTEELEGNQPNDRRFIQSAGPFTLKPGDVNDITIGIPWARAENGTPFESVKKLQRTDDKCQLLFENCFKMLDGPDAPELKIIALDRKLIFHIWNKTSSNNYKNEPEDYHEKDPLIVCPDISGDNKPDPCDKYYSFQGYQVYQLKDRTVNVNDIYDLRLARLVFQCDIQDGIGQLVNYYWDENIKGNVPVEEVNGQDKGISHTFTLTDDMFATGDKRLVNHKKYYYLAIAYAQNNYLKYDQNDPDSFDGQKLPYKSGRKGADGSIKTYEILPHINSPENMGTVINADYGQGPEISMIEGHGNGNNILELKQEIVDEIMSGSPWMAQVLKYENGAGPIQVKVIDPLNIPSDSYTLKFDSVKSEDAKGGYISEAKWFIYNSKGDTVFSDKFICKKLDANNSLFFNNEQLIPEWGFSICINQVEFPYKTEPNSGFLSASIQYENPEKPWLDFVKDQEGASPLNWIRSGTQTGAPNEDNSASGGFRDPDQSFEQVLNGTWAPYAATNPNRNGTAYNGNGQLGLIDFKFWRLSSVDLVITKDKSKWTRCCIVEMCESDTNDNGDPIPGLSGNYKFDLRDANSVDKDGNQDGSGTKGMGWFPGYAIDVQTGVRLNIMFGEDSWFAAQNGKDMKWNPTDVIFSDLYINSGGQSGDVYFGGKHVIYIVGQNDAKNPSMTAYDEGKNIYDQLSTGSGYSNPKKNTVFRNVMWCAIPLHNTQYDFLACDIKIRLRMANKYMKDVKSFANTNPQNNNWPMYTFGTEDIATIKGDIETAKDALEKINVVPNPYYGFSHYERTQIDNTVRFTNLPIKCTISIYNVNGTLVRRFSKDNPLTYQDWDLKNQYGIGIASGVYLIHVNAPELGEKILKWFGALRPLDLSSF